MIGGVDLDELAMIARARARCADGTARAIRRSHRLSLRELGAAVSVSHATLSRWETGERVPRGSNALRYGAVLDLLLEGADR